MIFHIVKSLAQAIYKWLAPSDFSNFQGLMELFSDEYNYKKISGFIDDYRYDLLLIYPFIRDDFQAI